MGSECILEDVGAPRGVTPMSEGARETSPRHGAGARPKAGDWAGRPGSPWRNACAAGFPLVSPPGFTFSIPRTSWEPPFTPLLLPLKFLFPFSHSCPWRLQLCSERL